MQRRNLVLHGGAQIWPTKAAAAGVTRMRFKMAEAVALALWHLVPAKTRRPPPPRRPGENAGHDADGTRPASSRRARLADERREGDAGRDKQQSPERDPGPEGAAAPHPGQDEPGCQRKGRRHPIQSQGQTYRRVVSRKVCTTRDAPKAMIAPASAGTRSSAVATPQHSHRPDRCPPEPARTAPARKGPVLPPRPGTPAVLGRAGSPEPRWRHDRRATATR